MIKQRKLLVESFSVFLYRNLNKGKNDEVPMNRNFEVELTTLCMIRNQKNEILVQERQKRIGLVGRFLADMLKNEGMETAMVRELLEETGLVLKPQLVGVAEWLNDCSGARELATLFIAETADELPEETEQPLFWVTEKELREGPLAGSLAELFPVFFGEKQFYFKNNTA